MPRTSRPLSTRMARKCIAAAWWSSAGKTPGRVSRSNRPGPSNVPQPAPARRARRRRKGCGRRRLSAHLDQYTRGAEGRNRREPAFRPRQTLLSIALHHLRPVAANSSSADFKICFRRCSRERLGRLRPRRPSHPYKSSFSWEIKTPLPTSGTEAPTGRQRCARETSSTIVN
jgi:hypothetical protein